MNKRAQRPQVYSDETIETRSVSSQLGGIKDSVLKSLWEDLLLGSANEGSKQVFGKNEKKGGEKKNAGELKAGQEITLAEFKKQTEIVAKKNEAHREYFREIQTTEIVARKQKDKIVETRVEEILVELKRLTQASKEMQTLFKEVSNDVNSKPVEIGTYHLNFYEWVLSVIRNARARIEEGNSWLSLFASKKKQRQYWNMYKKHGTTFGLSHERSVSTQVG